MTTPRDVAASFRVLPLTKPHPSPLTGRSLLSCSFYALAKGIVMLIWYIYGYLAPVYAFFILNAKASCIQEHSKYGKFCMWRFAQETRIDRRT